MTEQSVTLQPGEAKTITFEAIPHEAKTYNVSVDGLAGSFRAIAVGECNILRITIHTSPPVVGKRVALSVSLTNQSGVASPYHLDIYIDELRILSWNGYLLHRQGSNIGADFTPTRTGVHTAKAVLDYGREVLTKHFEVLPEGPAQPV